jgi:hypothetical protein
MPYTRSLESIVITPQEFKHYILEQKDYILREIEKIGLIISSIRQKLFGGKDRLSLTIENELNTASAMLLDETDFNLNKFLSLNIEESNEYICGFKGFSNENIELLADLILDIYISEASIDTKNHLEKALQLYELCNSKSKTYSLKRENKMIALKKAIQEGIDSGIAQDFDPKVHLNNLKANKSLNGKV